MHKVVVNSTPLIVLCKIGQLDILKKLYHEILIPTAVYREVTAVEDSACMQIKAAGEWIHVEQIQEDTDKKMYKAKLHDGEVEVMLLAQEKYADLVIIDDNAAKKNGKISWAYSYWHIGNSYKSKAEGYYKEALSLAF